MANFSNLLKSKRRKAAAIIFIIVTALYFNNASWLDNKADGTMGVLAHRGVHQTFRAEGLTKDTCTAKRINPPQNPYLENTIPSMRAGFAKGATVIELDVHPTTDNEFAVFHDWGLECRTDGKGVTRKQAMSDLKKLDVGYGYTADNGKTYPFRGKAIGMMPTLEEVLAAFPDKQFLINIKSNDADEADRLIEYLVKNGRPIDHRLWVFADGRPADRLLKLAPKAFLMSKKRLKACAKGYIALGWSGQMPEECRNGALAVPANLTWAYWGWPNRLTARLNAIGGKIMIVGPVGNGGPIGVTEPSQIEDLPLDFPGFIMTDEIEKIGPAVQGHLQAKAS